MTSLTELNFEDYDKTLVKYTIIITHHSMDTQKSTFTFQLVADILLAVSTHTVLSTHMQHDLGK